jgi:hypothetical protein
MAETPLPSDDGGSTGALVVRSASDNMRCADVEADVDAVGGVIERSGCR